MDSEINHEISAKIMLGFIKRGVEYRTCKAIVTLICVMQTTFRTIGSSSGC